MANPLEIPSIPHEYARDNNIEKLYNVGKPIDTAGKYARAVPEVVKGMYDELPLAEMAAETFFPFQYDDYEEATRKGETYKPNISSIAADILENVPFINAPVIAADVNNAYIKDGRSADEAARMAGITGAATMAADAVPFVGGKVTKFATKWGPKIGETVAKVLKKTELPTSISLGAGVPMGVMIMSEDKE